MKNRALSAQGGYSREETRFRKQGVFRTDTPGRKLENKSGRQTGAQNRSELRRDQVNQDYLGG